MGFIQQHTKPWKYTYKCNYSLTTTHTVLIKKMFSKHTCSQHGKTGSANIFSEFSKLLYTFENLNLRQTVTELQELCDVYIRNTQISVLLGTVEGGRSFLPLCQISGTGFCCKDRKRISVHGCLSHNKEHSNFILCRKTSTILRFFHLNNIFRV